MKATLLLVSLFSLSALAQDKVPATRAPLFTESAELRTVLSENPCINGKSRQLLRTELKESLPSEESFIGVTSFGDVAEVTGKIVNIYKCQIESDDSYKVHIASKVIVADAGEGCEFGQILVMTVYSGDLWRNLNFRSPVFSEKASLCNINRPSISDAARDAGKDINEMYEDAINSSKVSKE